MIDVAVLGSLNMDVVLRTARLPVPGETVLAEPPRRVPGGKGLNQAVAAARLGGRVAMIGRVGEDADGAALVRALADEGVDTAAVRHGEGPSGAAFIAVADDAENMILVCGGANAELTAVDAAPPRARVRLAQLESPVEAVAAFLSAEGDTLRILNAAPAREDCRHLLALADVVIVNETELAVYTGGREGEAAAALIRPGGRLVVTLGARGAAILGSDPVRVAAPPARAVDTAGAGDVFCGAFALGLARGMDAAAALAFAVNAGALAVERHGTSTAAPSLAEMLARGFDLPADVARSGPDW